MKKLRKRSRLLYGLGAVCLAGLLAGFFGSVLADRICLSPEPRPERSVELPGPVSRRMVGKRPEDVSGKSWLHRSRGIWQLYLEGDPFTIGYSAARLTDGLMRNLENDFLAMIKEQVPFAALRWLLRKYVMVRIRNLPDFVDEEFKLEILGEARGFTDHHPEIAPLYHRLGAYHAAHDISHFVMDIPLAPSEPMDGCTSFAAWGKHTAGGRLLAGRNFDFQGGRGFDKDKIVMFVRPEKGHAFLSVSWPGMMGVVSGLNEKLLYVSINAGSSSDSRSVGTPSCFVARRVLQYASSIEEAIAIIEAARMFVSDSFLIADGKSGAVVVVEKSPDRMGIRRPEGNFIVSANHYLTPVLSGDPKNLKYMRDSSSVARQERMTELLSGKAGKLDILSAAAILRDRGGDKDNAGEGADPRAINPLIATHSVIADVTAGLLWVSEGPHQLGEYVPFSVKDFSAEAHKPVIPADPFLMDGRYGRYVKAFRPAGY